MDKKIIVLAILYLFVIPNIIAFDFDNAKTYDASKKEVTITNAFGLGEELAKVKLLSPPTNYVIRGKDRLVAELEVTSSTDYQNFMSSIELYNIKNNMAGFTKKINVKKKSFVTLSYETQEVDTCNKKTLENGTQIDIDCKYKPKTVYYDREEWTALESFDIKKGETMVVGLFTDVEAGESTEFIPNFMDDSIRVQEWANWTDSLNTALEIYINFSEGTGTFVKDVKNYANGTITNASGNAVWVTGVFDNAVSFTNTRLAVSDYITLSNTNRPDMMANSVKTIAFWYKDLGYDSSDNGVPFGNDGAMGLYFNRMNTKFGFYDGVDYVVASTSVPASAWNGTWQHVAFVLGGTANNRIYLNGVSLALSGNLSKASANNGYYYIGRRTGVTNAFNGSIDEFAVWNRSLSQAEIQSLYWGATYNEVIGYPNITLVTPSNFYNSSSAQVTFNCTGKDVRGTGMLNLSLVINGKLNQTITNTTNNQTLSIQSTLGLIDVLGNWSCYGGSSAGNTYSENRTFIVDTTNPTVRIFYPINNSVITTYNTTSLINFNISAYDNVGLQYCWYNSNGTNYTRTCSTNLSIWTANGRFTWYYYANDSVGHLTTNFTTFNVSVVTATDTISQTDTGEGDTVTFILYVNRTAIPVTSAKLSIFSQNYTPDTTTSLADSYTFTKTITIPAGYGSKTGTNYTYNWTYNLSGETEQKTTDRKLLVYNLSIDECSVNTFKIFNLTLRDEDTKAVVVHNTSVFNGTTIEVDLNITSRANSSVTTRYYNNYYNNTNESIVICVQNGLVNNTNYRVDFTLSYISTGRVKEFYYMDNGTLDKTGYFNSYTSNNISLYDLAIANSDSFLFSFTDENGVIVPNSIVHVYRRYIGDGLFKEVERAKMDDNGETIIKLVQEDEIYYFMVTQDGQVLYTSSNLKAPCISGVCEITVNLDTGSIDWNTINFEDRNYITRVNKTSRMIYLDFTGNSSRLVNFSLYKTSYGDTTYLNSTSTTAISGTLSLPVPNSYGNETFMVRIYSDGVKIRDEFINFYSGITYFGTLGVFLAGIMILTLGLIAITEGVLVLVMIPIALVIVTSMALVDMTWLAISSFICICVILAIKLVSRTRKGNG